MKKLLFVLSVVLSGVLSINTVDFMSKVDIDGLSAIAFASDSEAGAERVSCKKSLTIGGGSGRMRLCQNCAIYDNVTSYSGDGHCYPN